ncbi:caspase family protein [Candidatus Marithioploca araucensis]|uniref:Caspase family protein n=1 Tax=Candidatus Marithioploca araucensis TaxID=70273 RepID=A0ABT7VTT9_9GAMM|nr:caspase family protein [Candidatus Marithioploca araucensis]
MVKQLTNLEGAVNDAKLLRDALREAQVQLPDRRVLLDANATRSAFIHAWRDMLKQAKVGDTLIVTFAGHGGQQPDTKPLDEKDNKDETLMFHDFNPNHPSQGRITDDELRGLLNKASPYNILFIVDACHSSGLKRSMAAKPLGRVRSGGSWNLTPSLPTLQTESDEEKFPEHVTMITAVDNDILVVREEKLLDNKQHGALSWYFAKALHGEADGNENGHLERDELERFLTEKVRTKTNYSQMPKLLPRADTKSVVILPSKAAFKPPPLEPKVAKIAIIVENARVPSGLKQVRHVNQSQAFDLRFIVKNRYTEVFNNTGNKVITSLPSDALNLWQRVIDKERLLKVLETQFDMRLKPIKITLREGNKNDKKRREILEFSITPSDTKLNALTLFNLAGNGELQFLYPSIQHKDTLIVKQFPYKLPMEVTSPFGGDDLIAVLCKKPAKGLHRLLKKTQPNIPAPEQIISQLRGNTCQVGQYAFFSRE